MAHDSGRSDCAYCSWVGGRDGCPRWFAKTPSPLQGRNPHGHRWCTDGSNRYCAGAPTLRYTADVLLWYIDGLDCHAHVTGSFRRSTGSSKIADVKALPPKYRHREIYLDPTRTTDYRRHRCCHWYVYRFTWGGRWLFSGPCATALHPIEPAQHCGNLTHGD